MVRELIGNQALNRAYLSRQLLVERATMPVPDAVEHLVGLQAQAPKPPYYALCLGWPTSIPRTWRDRCASATPNGWR